MRDPALPFQWRVSALRSCVQLYKPLGFQATLSYLEAKAGRFQREEAALLQALALVEASRAARQVAVQAYAARRREAKKRGRRVPGTREIDPNVQARFYWYGAPREAALFALWFWREHRSFELTSVELVECVEKRLRATAGQHDSLVVRIREVESRLQSWELLQVVRHVEVALGLWTDSGLIRTGAVAIS
ncbi:hypothetical protein ABZ917_07225 [Nonomuraea wenchangensis]